MTSSPNPRASIDGSDAGIQPASSTSRFIGANGLKLHYLDYGTEGRPPMLCVHGGAAHGHWFDFVAGGFTLDYHVRARWTCAVTATASGRTRRSIRSKNMRRT